MPRVVGTDPGSSSLDLLLLDDGRVAGQARLTPEALRRDPTTLAATLDRWRPIDLVAGPSGYGLPLVAASDLTEGDIDLMALVRPDERGEGVGIVGFRRWVRDLVATALPILFLPGGALLPTIPAHRKANTVDLGTADKVAVAALALRMHAEAESRPLDSATFALAEIGSAFAAILVVSGGKLVDASAGTRGPIGLRCGGAWDGEAAYLLSPLSKADLFRGGLIDLGASGPAAFAESLLKHAAAMRAATPFETLYLSGAGVERPEVADLARDALGRVARVAHLPRLPGAWVKHAAQGSALLADGLAGGENADLVESLELRAASGTIWGNLGALRPDRPGGWPS